MIAIVDDDKLISGILKKILLSKFPGEDVSVFSNDNSSLISFIEANPLRGLIIRAESANESYSYPGLKLYEDIYGNELIPTIISFDSLESLTMTKYGYLLEEKYRYDFFNYLQMPFRLSCLIDLIGKGALK